MNRAPSPAPAVPPPIPPSAADSRASSGRDAAAVRPAAIPPLLPVLFVLAGAAIVAAIVLARLFPATDQSTAAPTARFADVTEISGVRFHGRGGLADTPTTLGGAVTVFDFNRDGRPDLFFPGSLAWPWDPAPAAPQPSALYRNDGDGRFTEVAAAAGLTAPLQGMAATSGDFDRDGWPDLFVTGLGASRLFRNQGDGTFADVTEAAGVGGDDNTWSTGATWIDFDQDGELDLVVAHYARWPQDVALGLAFAIADVGRSYGTPTGFIGAFPSVYRNLGHGRFELVRDGAGLSVRDAQTGLPREKALAVTPLDANSDGRLDLLFTYHAGERALFLATDRGSFRPATGAEERHEGTIAGVAGSIAATAGADERTALLPLSETARAADDAGETISLRGKLGVALLDCDLDGRAEWFSGEGRLEGDLNKFATRALAAPARMLWRRGAAWSSAVLENLSPASDPARGAPAVRAVATADFDGDGDSDLVLVPIEGPARILRNEQRSGAPWLRLTLTATRSHPDAGGARVEVQTPRRTHTQTVAPALGFFAQSESTLTFGLGDDARVRRVVIRWPSGQQQEFRPEGLNRVIELREP